MGDLKMSSSPQQTPFHLFPPTHHKWLTLKKYFANSLLPSWILPHIWEIQKCSQPEIDLLSNLPNFVPQMDDLKKLAWSILTFPEIYSTIGRFESNLSPQQTSSHCFLAL
jgi:hypothetical protein